MNRVGPVQNRTDFHSCPTCSVTWSSVASADTFGCDKKDSSWFIRVFVFCTRTHTYMTRYKTIQYNTPTPTDDTVHCIHITYSLCVGTCICLDMRGNGHTSHPPASGSLNCTHLFWEGRRTNSDKRSGFGPSLIQSHKWKLYLHFTSFYNNSMTMCWIMLLHTCCVIQVFGPVLLFPAPAAFLSTLTQRGKADEGRQSRRHETSGAYPWTHEVRVQDWPISYSKILPANSLGSEHSPSQKSNIEKIPLYRLPVVGLGAANITLTCVLYTLGLFSHHCLRQAAPWVKVCKVFNSYQMQRRQRLTSLHFSLFAEGASKNGEISK